MVKKKEYKRILICGTGSGSGKNWLGEKLSEKFRVKFYDTDDLAWVKRFTVKREYDKKCKMLKDIAKKDKWIIATGATSYVGPAEKRANLIIILDIGFFRSTYRILKRDVQHSRGGKEKSLHSPLKLAYINFLHHKRRNGKGKYIERLMKKYPKKVKVFSQSEKRKFLRDF